MVSKYEDGSHDMGPEILRRAAELFNVTPSFILFGESVIYAKQAVPLIGRVGAGATIEAVEDADPQLIEVPGEYRDTLAYRVVGGSCEPVFEDGDIVITLRQGVGEGEFLNRYCVVQTAGGNGYIKKISDPITVPGHGKLYTLKSPNADDLPRQEIEWARPVLMRIINLRR